MTLKSFRELREDVFAGYKRQFPGEKLYSKVFSVYVMDKYIRLLMRIYKKSEEIKNKDA